MAILWQNFGRSKAAVQVDVQLTNETANKDIMSFKIQDDYVVQFDLISVWL